MQEIFAIIIAFILIPLWSKLKLKLSVILVITGVLLCVIGAVSLNDALKSLLEVFTDAASRNTLITVILVGILGALMKEYGLWEKILSSLKKLIYNSKITIMLFPAIIGCLNMPGGAYLSAPFVDRIGEEINQEKSKRAAINLSFRHIAMFLLPFTLTMQFVSASAPNINIYHIIALNLPLVIIASSASYMLFLKKTPKPQNVNKVKGGKLKALGEFLLNISPILAALIMNITFSVPMWIAMTVAIFITWILSSKKNFLKVIFHNINIDIAIMLAAAYFIRNIVESFDNAAATLTNLFLTCEGAQILAAIAAISIILGMISGNALVPLGLMIPLTVTLPLSYNQQLVYIFFIMAWSFMGYYFTPLHMCQMLTLKSMGVETKYIYKEQWPLFITYGVSSTVLFYIYSAILN